MSQYRTICIYHPSPRKQDVNYIVNSVNDIHEYRLIALLVILNKTHSISNIDISPCTLVHLIKKNARLSFRIGPNSVIIRTYLKVEALGE